MARQKVIITHFPGKMKRLVRRGWILQGQTRSFLQPTQYTLVKPAHQKEN